MLTGHIENDLVVCYVVLKDLSYVILYDTTVKPQISFYKQTGFGIFQKISDLVSTPFFSSG